jgi:hypothetical protein
MRVNRSQDFVIGGYTIGGNSFDALVFGYYRGMQLMCVHTLASDQEHRFRVHRTQNRKTNGTAFRKIAELQ